MSDTTLDPLNARGPAAEKVFRVYGASQWVTEDVPCVSCGAPVSHRFILPPPGTTTTVYVGPVWCADCGARARAENEARQAASRRAWAEEVYARHFAAVGADRTATLAALERVYEEWEE